jgi:hypothetical protein
MSDVTPQELAALEQQYGPFAVVPEYVDLPTGDRVQRGSALLYRLLLRDGFGFVVTADALWLIGGTDPLLPAVDVLIRLMREDLVALCLAETIQ